MFVKKNIPFCEISLWLFFYIQNGTIILKKIVKVIQLKQICQALLVFTTAMKLMQVQFWTFYDCFELNTIQGSLAVKDFDIKSN